MANTALTIPNQGALQGTGSLLPCTGGVPNANFSIGGWIKVNNFVGQYVTLMALYKTSNPGENNSYMWFGFDSTAGSGLGTRGWAYYLPVAGHSTTTPMTTGQWYHWCLTRNNNIWTGYTNGIQQYWDDGSGNPYVDYGGSYDEIDRLTMFSEVDFPGDTTACEAKAVFACNKTLSQAEVLKVMKQKIPGNDIQGFNGTGVWTLTGPTDLSSRVGGPPLIVAGSDISNFGVSTLGPSALNYSVEQRARGFGILF